MSKETSPQSKIELEIEQKRKLLEETLTAKMLREMLNKIPIKEDRVVFKVANPYAFEDLLVIKIVDDKAEVILRSEMKKNKPTSMLRFKISELWDVEDYLSIRKEIAKMGSAEIAAKISQSNLTN